MSDIKLNKTETHVMKWAQGGYYSCVVQIKKRGRVVGIREQNAVKSLVKKGLATLVYQGSSTQYSQGRSKTYAETAIELTEAGKALRTRILEEGS